MCISSSINDVLLLSFNELCARYKGFFLEWPELFKTTPVYGENMCASCSIIGDFAFIKNELRGRYNDFFLERPTFCRVGRLFWAEWQQPLSQPSNNTYQSIYRNDESSRGDTGLASVDLITSMLHTAPFHGGSMANSMRLWSTIQPFCLVSILTFIFSIIQTIQNW